MDAPDRNAGAAAAPAAWSLQRRLAAGLLACIGGTFALLFPALDHWIDREIYRRMDTVLMQRAAAVARVLQQGEPRGLERLMPEYEPGGHTEFFTLFDADSGRALLRSPSSVGAALPLPPGPAGKGLPRRYDATLPDGHAGRAVAVPLASPGRGPRILVVATEREHWDRTERRIHFALLGGMAVATLLATGLALLMVRRIAAMLERAGAALAGIRADQPIRPIGADFPREFRPFADAFNLGLHRLQQAAARERRFSRDVAHELRTPVAEIRTSAQSALADAADPEHARQALRAALRASARMQRSVDALLLLARLECGQHVPAPDPLDLAALLRELLAASSGHSARPGRPVRAVLPESAWVQSDLGVVERIVSNLLRNATEYAPPGGEIECRLERRGAGWMLCIANTAPDLRAGDLEQFGVRFWRKDSEGGTAHHAGLGLALALALAQAIALPLGFALDGGRLTAELGPWEPLL